MSRAPVWWSLCCGLDATASWAMARRRPPVSRMGGKRAYSADVLRILGDWPKVWRMIDADPAIVLWWSAVFEGWLGEVAERIRAYELDGEELWRSIVYANGKDGTEGPAAVPEEPVDRLAAWLIAQKGNFSAKPLGWAAEGWQGVAGFNQYDASKPRQGNWATFKAVETGKIADKLDAWQGVAGFRAASKPGSGNWHTREAVTAEKIAGSVTGWQGVAGYGHLSEAGKAKGYPDRVNREAVASALGAISGKGAALFADLNTWAPDVQPGDLVTIDPPYAGTTGYGEILPRERVVDLALQADAAGARVLVHEAEPILDLGDGRTWWRWGALDLRKGERKNQDTWRKRGKHGSREVVTINFEPAGRLGEQALLPLG